MDITNGIIKRIECSLFDDSLDSYESILIDLGELGTIFIKVNENTDELIIEASKKKLDIQKRFKVWGEGEKYTGKKIVNSWICSNSDGYFDLFVLAIDDFQPKLLITSAASQLYLSECN